MLEHHTDLGSGIGSRCSDLELRGAGNLLGGEQSGHAHAVGFDMYLRWLEETVRALKGEGEPAPAKCAPPDVMLDQPAHLPDEYVGDDDAKLDLYRRLARAEHRAKFRQCARNCAIGSGPLLPKRSACSLVCRASRARRPAGTGDGPGQGRRGAAHVPAGGARRGSRG